jgi:hypothetical protein
MLSGNGRHRRPRQAPAFVVAAGVTGSALALPLLAATGASAADGSTWDKVADCESGGTWSADEGNGYYGGLQLTQEDWQNYGGTDYASRPDQASRSQQIAVAEKILADQGSGAFSTCGLLSGLGGEEDEPIDLGTGETGDSSGSAAQDEADSSESASSDAAGGSAEGDAGATDSGEGSGQAKGDAKGEETGKDKSDKSGKSGDSSSGDEAASGDTGKEGDAGTGRHRGASADESAADGAGDGSTGRHASRGGDTSADAEGGAAESTVRAEDLVTAVTDSLGLGGGWSGLFAADDNPVGTDPTLNLAGQTLGTGGETGQK